MVDYQDYAFYARFDSAVMGKLWVSLLSTFHIKIIVQMIYSTQKSLVYCIIDLF